MTSVKTLVKTFFLFILLGFIVVGLTSFNVERSPEFEDANFSKDNYNVKKLINTSWKIKYIDCQACGERADDIQFLEMGKGFIESKPLRWFVRQDTVYLQADMGGCQFEKVILADDNLMYGSFMCKGAANPKSFTARKNGAPESTAAVLPNSAKPNTIDLAKAKTSEEAKPYGLKFIDKTYMFKRGKEKRYGERRIDAIILHSSFCVNSKNDFDVYCVLAEYKRHGVAAHYLIDREGVIHRLVDENDVAFHAGFGHMPDGNDHINTRSLGIELINSEDTPPNEEQYASLANLVRDIKSRHRIKYIKGHNQICPDRKTDPWRFSWKKFYELVNID
jgi:hypothetical protein